MQLQTSTKAPEFFFVDTNDVAVRIESGKRTLLSFFRDTNCPFCNLRVFQLTQRHKDLAQAGLVVIAFFSSSHEDVAHFVRNRPRPFQIVADPENIAYKHYGIQKSFSGKLQVVFTRLLMWITGMKILGITGTIQGMGGLNTNNILPADFLIDENGYIVEAYYGQDIGDHIPFERIENFLKEPK